MYVTFDVLFPPSLEPDTKKIIKEII